MAKSGIKDCAKSYAAKFGVSVAEAEKIMRNAVEVIKDEIVNEGGVAFMGVFTLEAVDRAEKQGRNPATGEPMTIPAYRTVKLTAGKTLKEELN